MPIKVKFPPIRGWQKDIIQDDHRFKVLVCHRRAWKTVVSLLYMLKNALEQEKGKHYAYIAPFYKQAKNIAWDILKKQVRNIPQTKINEAELKVTLANGSRIQLFWADNPDSLRWLDIYGTVFDEYAQQPSNIYWEIIFPMINAHNWWVIWIWTPKGKNDFHNVYQKWLKDDKYFVKVLRASESGLLNEEQLLAARQEMTPEEYDQEYECSWEASIKWAYYKEELKKTREEWRIKSWLFDPVLDVYTFWDLWMSDTMSIGFFQIHWWQVRLIDYYEANWHWFEHYKSVLSEKGYNYAKHFFPHDITVRELWSGQSRLETVKAMLWEDKVSTLPKLKIIDWIQALRRIFHNIWFDAEKTETVREALALYRQKYDEVRWIYLTTPEHDWTSHCADMMRYMAVGYNKLTEDTRQVEYEIMSAYDDYLND